MPEQQEQVRRRRRRSDTPEVHKPAAGAVPEKAADKNVSKPPVREERPAASQPVRGAKPVPPQPAREDQMTSGGKPVRRRRTDSDGKPLSKGTPAKEPAAPKKNETAAARKEAPSSARAASGKDVPGANTVKRKKLSAGAGIAGAQPAPDARKERTPEGKPEQTRKTSGKPRTGTYPSRKEKPAFEKSDKSSLPAPENPPKPRKPEKEDKPKKQAPLKIIIDDTEDRPEWFVSASNLQDAASKRSEKVNKKSVAKAQEKQKTADPYWKENSSVEIAMVDARSAGDAASAGISMVDARSAPDAQEQMPQEPREDVVRAQKPESPKKAPRPAPGKEKVREARTAGEQKGPGVQLDTGKVVKAVIGLLAASLCIFLVVIGVQKISYAMDVKKTLDKGSNSAGKEVFYPNIYMNDIPLEGKTLDDAAAIVSHQVESLISAFRIVLRTEDGRNWTITGQDLNMRYDVADQLDQVWSIGHTGNSATRYEQVKALENSRIERYTTLTYDLSCVNQILNSIKEEVDKPAVNATRVDDPSKWPPFSYTDDVPGVTLDISGMKEHISKMVDELKSGVVVLTPTPVQARVTRQALEGQIVKLATYETAIGATSHEGRFRNIEIGTLKFNHKIISAGETVSFNKIAGKRTEANGYVEAPEIAYGEYVMGIGGGICQVSSTLYNCVVNAGLEIKNRAQHSLASNYVPMGQDATVSDDRLDFVFRNNTNAELYFETAYYKKKNYWYTQFTIYGRPDPEGHTYKLESEIREEIPLPEPTYRPDKKAEYCVYTDQTYQISKGEVGYIVDVYLVTMDKNGLQLSRDFKYTDTYKPLTPVYYVGVTPRE